MQCLALFSVAEHSAAAWQWEIVLKEKEGPVSFGWFPAGCSQGIYSALAMAEMFCMNMCTWRRLEQHPPSFSVSLEKK